MRLYEVELRLVATDDEGTKAAVWGGSGWVLAPKLAGKARAGGTPLTAEEAAKEYPGADLEAIPAL
jgi:hypothetical protein